MKIEEIKEIIKSTKENNIESITIELIKEKIYINNKDNNGNEYPHNKIANSNKNISKVEEEIALNLDINQSDDKLEEINKVVSPLVGIAYLGDNKNTNSKYAIGDKIKKGDVIFSIEAMKLLNNIKSTENGIIKSIYIEDGDMVQYNQPIIGVVSEE